MAVRSREATAVFENPELDDEAKEKVLQGLAMRLFGLLGLLTVGGAVALLPGRMIGRLHTAGVLSLVGILDMLQRWDVLIAATLLSGGILAVPRPGP